ncbi:hypothetical protein DFP72DRAFT_872769, partial [Ephemerocybe angulata]
VRQRAHAVRFLLFLLRRRLSLYVRYRSDTTLPLGVVRGVLVRHADCAFASSKVDLSARRGASVDSPSPAPFCLEYPSALKRIGL